MTIATYTDLHAAVQAWVNHAQANARIPDFITLAEGEISADLLVDPMKLEQSVSFSAGASEIPLPANLIDPEQFRLLGARLPDIVMASREMLAEFAANTRAYDSQRTYGALVGRTLKLFPTQTVDGTVAVYGKCAIPPLSSDAPTNWLLTSFPNVYLFGAIREAGSFMRDEAMIAWAEGRYQQAVAKVNKQFQYRGHMGQVTSRSVR